MYPERLRRLSDKHWTPVAVAMRAAAMLAEGGCTRVLDVGAGVGKLCIVGALATEAWFTGVEERRDRVDAARAAAAAFRLGRVAWVHGRLEQIALGRFDGFYLFNPFAEALEPGPEGPPGLKAEARYHRDVARMVAALAAAPSGLRVVTYHGFGAPMPPGYCLVAREDHVTGPLECWERTGRG